MKVTRRFLLAASLLSGRCVVAQEFSTSSSRDEFGCYSDCECSGLVDTNDNGGVFDEYCAIDTCTTCSATCYQTDPCCTPYMRYCDDNFRVLTQFDKVGSGNCKGTSTVTLGRTGVCFGLEDTLPGTAYSFDDDTNCLVGCAQRAQEGGYDGFAYSDVAGNILQNCPTDDGVDYECFCSLVTGTIGGVQTDTASYTCYSSATCTDGVANGEETGIDCGGPDCDTCPCTDSDVDGICDDEDSCPDNYFNDEDGVDGCSGADGNFCAATGDNNYLGDVSLCAFSLKSLGLCSNDPISVQEVADRDACHVLCTNEPTCGFFAFPSVVGGDSAECFLFDTCDYYPTLTYGENLDIFQLLETCYDGILNQDELTVDCSGVCTPTCSHCDDGVMNYDEEGTDCGGDTCTRVCASFELVGEGYCLGHNDCVSSFCFETTSLQNSEWACMDESTAVSGDSCVEATIAYCTDEYGAELRGVGTDASQGDCVCSAKCYHSADVDVRVQSASATDDTSEMECYQVALCSDGVLNGDETNVDCGGPVCTPICDVDNDGVVDEVDSCPDDPQNDADADGLCRDDDACPFRATTVTTEAVPTYRLSNGMPYCQYTATGEMCGGTAISENALSDYSDVYAVLYPYEFMPKDMEEICYNLCTNIESCSFFTLTPGASIQTCWLHAACSYDDLLVLDNAASYVLLETCFDGVLNQNEESVDCGGVCEPLCACTSCITHDFVEEDGECSACTEVVVYDDKEFTEAECGQLCELLGSSCDAFTHASNGVCNVHSNCGLYGSELLGRRRRLKLPPKQQLWQQREAPTARPKGDHEVTQVPTKTTTTERRAFGSGLPAPYPAPTPAPLLGDTDSWAAGKLSEPHPSPYGRPSPAPSERSLLTTRRALQEATATDPETEETLQTTFEPDVPAPCNCCYQNYWEKMGPKAGAEVEGGCRICDRDDCYSKKRCYDESGDPGDIQWICPQTSTASTPVSQAQTTSPEGGVTVFTTDPPTTLDYLDCGAGGELAIFGDGSYCSSVYEDVAGTIEAVEAMVSTGSLLDSFQVTHAGAAVSSATSVEFSSSPEASYFDDVVGYDDGIDALVSFELIVNGLSNADVGLAGVMMDIRNSIADNTALGQYTAHILIEASESTRSVFRSRNRRMLESSVFLSVTITLPATDAVLTTTTTATLSGCMLKQSCGDGVKNGNEDFIDCGGGSCDDCEPTCSDGTLNGAEEDVDCGGDCDECPIDCVEDWSEYTACSVTCGGDGIKSRSWIVTIEGQFGGESCTEAAGVTESAACEAGDLDAAVCPVDCVGAWTVWGECTRTCGQVGKSYRTFDVSQSASDGGQDCEFVNAEVEQLACNTDTDCPVDCKGSWSDWSCDATCGSAVTGSRSFTVKSEAKFGGAECEVDDAVVEAEECPGDCCAVECPVTIPPNIGKDVKFGTISGGVDNYVYGDYGTVVGGAKNLVDSGNSAIAGGTRNTVVSSYTMVGGGRANVIGGRFSAIPGGSLNTVWGKDSFAIGHDAKVRNCQQNTAVLAYGSDDETCTFSSAAQEAGACEDEGNAIQMCADSVMYNGVDLTEAFGAAARRKLDEVAPTRERTLQNLLSLEQKYIDAITKVENAIAAAQR